ncbi:hypothetical protein ABZ172_11975 [Streptomyces sp. NPDC006296]|uniref:hypothetical protein n=1 Tax=Streptomyces sp. NPDC006296 TaxID=3156746 RepID=UPI0033BE2B54
MPSKFNQLVIQCPYCGNKHRHGNLMGTRVPHCAEDKFDRWDRQVSFSSVKNSLPTYDLCPPDPEVNWSAEYLRAHKLMMAHVEEMLLSESWANTGDKCVDQTREKHREAVRKWYAGVLHRNLASIPLEWKVAVARKAIESRSARDE